jgi:glutaconate CoA-transferase, subunit A
LIGVQKEVAFAAEKVIVVVEELVDSSVIRSDPNRTLVPGLIVDAVVIEPFGAHPSYVQGYYDRDNAFYLEWDRVSRDTATTGAWIEEWVFGVNDRSEYLAKLGEGILEGLRPASLLAAPVDYGQFR